MYDFSIQMVLFLMTSKPGFKVTVLCIGEHLQIVFLPRDAL